MLENATLVWVFSGSVVKELTIHRDKHRLGDRREGVGDLNRGRRSDLVLA